MKFIDNNGNETTLQEGQSMFVDAQGVVTIVESDEFHIPFRVKLTDLPDIIATHCEIGGYSPKIHAEGSTEVIDNPITPAQFVWRRVRDFAVNPVVQSDLESKKEQKLAEITPREVIVKGS